MAGGAPLDTSLSASAPISRRVYWMAFALITSLFFLWGFSYGLLDVLNRHFQTVFGITKLQSTGLQATYFGAYLVWSYPAGVIMSKFGYKKGIYMGLGLYSTGAILFWPMAHFETFGGFCGATFIIGCGLATLEVAANSYVSVLGKNPKEAAFLLNFAQSFNGLAAFTGPLMASNLFFKGANAHSLTNVQYVYLAVSILGALVAIAFYFCPIPEITESSLQAKLEAEGAASEKPLWKRHHTTLGFVTQLFYVGAQVATASFVLNLATECKNPFTSEEASRLFGYMQITFMVARFVSTALLKFVEPTILLGTYGLLASALMVGVAISDTRAGVYMLFGIFFFESTMYPTIFTTATSNTGALAKRASALLVMGVAGGAAFPPMQGAVADATSTHTSYFISFMGFVVVTLYGYGYYIHKRWFDKSTPQVSDEEASSSRPESIQTPVDEKKEFDGSAPVSTLTY